MYLLVCLIVCSNEFTHYAQQHRCHNVTNSNNTELIIKLACVFYTMLLQDEGYTVRYYILSCGISTYYRVWLIITVAYKLVIHFVGAVLAILSRKAKVDPFNDSKYTALIVYTSCMILTLTLVIQLTTPNHVNIHTLSWTMLVFGGSCIILGLTFLPKVSQLISSFDPFFWSFTMLFKNYA